MNHRRESGFTLIELSIVLVIIGLIVGGILVGQDLIRSAAIRAQIAQIESFNTAVNTFYGKYQALPGDMNAATAAQFGFASRSGAQGAGDGNGIIEGGNGLAAIFMGPGMETGTFWDDLTYAHGQNLNLIPGSFAADEPIGTLSNTAANPIALYLPQAKLGANNYIYVYSTSYLGAGQYIAHGTNYYGLSAITTFCCVNQLQTTKFALTVSQAYTVDSKMDDGSPLTGKVTAQYLYSWVGTADATHALSASSSTCYDNGGNTANPVNYSLSLANANSLNCSLTFQFP